MRLPAFVIASATCLTLSSAAFAQDAWDQRMRGGPPPQQAQPMRATGDDWDAKKIGLGGDLQAFIPTGDLSDASSFMIGPVLRGGYRPLRNVEVTGRLGYVFGFPKEPFPGTTARFDLVPIWAGARYFFQEQAPAGAYAGGEMGINLLRFHSSYDGPASPFVPDSATQTETRFGMNFFGGYVLSRELPIDFRGSLSFLNIGDGGPGFAIGLSAGYTYSL